MTFVVNALLIKEFHIFVLFQKSNIYSENPDITWLCILYLVTKIISLQKKKSLPKNSNARNGLPSYEI